ncbi:MAG TPA: F0F1 ATP synthase subunit B [Verrucomicrobiae bacterium]|nr:F0F1 ATP synthase subunit B [Verrucomicrobiae bacterium]
MDILHIDATLVVQILSFLLLLAILRKFAYRPLLDALEKRSQYIEDSIKNAEQQRAEAEQIRAEYQANLKQARQEAQAIIERATKASEDRSKEIINEARDEADRLKKSAVAEIDMEKQKALTELRNQVAVLSVLAAGKVIEKNLDPATQSALVDEFIKEVGDLPC